MNKKALLTSVVVIAVVFAGTYYFFSRSRNIPKENTFATFTHPTLGFTIDYLPAGFVAETLSDGVTIEPRYPADYPCSDSPLAEDLLLYLRARLEQGTLGENRAQHQSKVGGQDWTESVTTIGGRTAYFYKSPDYPNCPEETSATNLTRTVLIADSQGRVFSIFTRNYQFPSVQEMMRSFRFSGSF